uniref:Uncharacterized protein n=1 Tax=Parascaris univalens TaxID=6257 RepID=A0A915BIC1_PARUN
MASHFSIYIRQDYRIDNPNRSHGVLVYCRSVLNIYHCYASASMSRTYVPP